MVTVCRARRSVGSGMDCAGFCAEVSGDAGSTCPFQSISVLNGATGRCKVLMIKDTVWKYLTHNPLVVGSNPTGPILKSSP